VLRLTTFIKGLRIASYNCSLQTGALGIEAFVEAPRRERLPKARPDRV